MALTIAMDAARFAGGRGIVLAVHAKVKAKPSNLGFRLTPQKAKVIKVLNKFLVSILKERTRRTCMPVS